MRTMLLLCLLSVSCWLGAAEDIKADVVPVDEVVVLHKANSVVISQSDEGLRTIFVVITERKEDTDSQTKINALKDAIKQLEVRIDVLKKTKKDEEKAQKIEGKAMLETLPGEDNIKAGTYESRVVSVPATTETQSVQGVLPVRNGDTTSCSACSGGTITHYVPSETRVIYTAARTTVEPDGTILPDGHIVMNGCRTCWRVHGWPDSK